MARLGWGIFCLVLCLRFCSGSHFGGGILSWRPSTNSSAVTLVVRLSWRLSSFRCNSQTVPSNSYSLNCQGCSVTPFSIPFYCTDYSNVGYTWSSGLGTRTVLTTRSDMTYSYNDGAWIHFGSWILVAKANLAVRSDTGAINNPPVVDMIPIIHWDSALNHTLQIPVHDIDGDTVKCRWAINYFNGTDECLGVCNQFTEAILDQDTCTLRYTGNALLSNYRAVAIQVEDFSSSDLSSSLSSIPVQFLVLLYSNPAQIIRPTFISPTPDDNAVIFYKHNTQVSINITAKGQTSLNTIDTISPIGLLKSTVVTWSNTSGYYITTTLTRNITLASVNDAKAHVICFSAFYDNGYASEVRCVHFRDSSLQGLGGSCTSNAACKSANSKCESNVCVCNDGYVTSNTKTKCEPETGIGGECSVNETCVTPNSICASSSDNGVCVCVTGFVTSYKGTACEEETGLGGDCTVDATCTLEDSVCSGNTGESTCICRQGFTTSQSGTSCQKVHYGDYCGREVTCHTPGAACVKNICTCHKTGVYSKVHELCDTMDLFYYGEGYDNSFPAVQSKTQAIEFPAGIPIFSKSYTRVFVSSNGLVSLGSPFTNPTPTRGVAAYPTWTFLSPYYSNIQGGKVHYRFYDVFTNIDDLDKDDVIQAELLVNKYGQTDYFKAKFILFVTWEDVQPYAPSTVEQLSQEATFQLVLITDGVDTSVMYIYGHDQMKWSDTSPANVWIGFTAAGLQSEYHVQSFTKFAVHMDIYAETKGVKGLLFYRLTTAGSTRQNEAILCFNWFTENKAKAEEKASIAARLPQCPCDIDSLGKNPWYTSFTTDGQPDDVECAIVYAAEKYSPHGKTCCYNITTGLWITERPYAGTYLDYHLSTEPANYKRHDADIKKLCCHQSSYCDLFYQLKPVGGCYNESWFRVASTWGDPHISTLDGLKYTFNGLGEYILSRVSTHNVTFEAQARTGNAVLDDGRESDDATVFTAFAATDQSGASVHVEIDDKEGFVIYGNKADLTKKFKKKKSFEHTWKNLVLKRYRNNTLFVLFPKSDISLKISIGVRLLKMITALPTYLRNKTEGLLGNYDGDPTNDIRSPDGQTPDTNITEAVAYEYGLLWEVENSILNYDDKKSHADYQFPNFKPRFLDEVSPDKIEKALEYCDTIENQACIFDYVFTQSRSLAVDTLDTDRIVTNTRAELASVTPYLTGCEETFATVGDVVTCMVTYGGGGDVVIEFIENDVNAIYNATAQTVVYTVTSDDPPNLTIVAVKKGQDKEKKSPPVHVPLRICSGCSGHGVCSPTKVRKDKRETVKIKYAECKCYTGYAGDDCEANFDGCESEPCSLGRDCTDLSPEDHNATGKAYTCADCPHGYADDGTQCADIDECDLGTDDCEQNCTNTDGGYTCTCLDGYRPSRSNTNQCADINECDEAQHNCRHICENTLGGHVCSCYNGYVIDANATNECVPEFDPGSTTCDQASLNCSGAHGCMEDDDGIASCLCEDGYQLDATGTECIDINECDGQLCDMTCDNFDGGYSCGCLPGYELHERLTCKGCEPPFWGDDCANVCNCSATGTLDCNRVLGCVCKAGWTGDQCNEDIDECDVIVDVCGDVRKECVNTDGSFYCRCQYGYEDRGDGCKDIDECADPTKHKCEQTCMNTVGGYVCGCEDGFTKNGSFTCKDINECESRRTGCEHQCENFPGLSKCTCYYGYIINDDRRTCRKHPNINPCEGYTDITCDQICVVSREDVAECRCAAGYELGKDGISCFDIDECKTEQPCSENAICENIPGSYVCKCPLGSKLENDEHTCTVLYHYGENCEEVCSCLKGNCDRIKGCICEAGWTGENCDQDINECKTVEALCTAENEVCQNTHGGYKCVCGEGFLNVSGVCEDIDECTNIRSHDCPQLCINTPGSYFCSCSKGFLELNGRCIDIDECEGSHGCAYKCINTHGNYRCSCPAGFTLDRTGKRSCFPAKACDDTELGECSEHADCFIEDNIPKCICRKGYVGNGSTCNDIKECASDVPPCSHTCVEEDGAYHCECSDGFILDNDLSSCKECKQGTFGKNCEQKCLCQTSNTKRCDPVTGACECKGQGQGAWSGATCVDDVDECETGTASCPDNSDCVNTDGSYICKCHPGYLMTSKDVCEACDKLHYGDNCAKLCICNVSTTTTCDKVNGMCNCSFGWESEDCSVNINECKIGQRPCSQKVNSVCRDTQGSYACDCLAGFIEQSGHCEDINECLDKDTDIECPPTDSRRCINEPGTYRCECLPGYSGDGVTCTGCLDNTYGQNCSEKCPCDMDRVIDTSQACDTVDGTCTCNAWWTGDRCEDNVNECLNSNACPGANSGCIDIDEGYECDCLWGFEMLNGVCSAKPPTTPIQGTTRPMTVIFDVELSPDLNLAVAKVYEAFKREAEKSLTQHFEEIIGGKFLLMVTGLRRGSLVVDYVIVLEDEETDKDSLFQAVSALSQGKTIEFRNQTVGASSGDIDNTTEPCTQYLSVLGECVSGYKCVVKDDAPSCRKISDQDLFALTIGLGMGIPLFVLMVVLLIICARLSGAKRRARRRENREKHVHSDNREKHVHSGPVTRKPRRLNRTEITKKEVKGFEKARNKGSRQPRSTRPDVDAVQPSWTNFSTKDWKLYVGNKPRNSRFAEHQHADEPVGDIQFHGGGNSPWRHNFTGDTDVGGVSSFTGSKLGDYEPRILHNGRANHQGPDLPPRERRNIY